MNNKNILAPFEKIFSMENIFKAWKDFKKGKKNKKDVSVFSMNLINNLSILQRDILSGNYRHNKYFHFKINDPKPRDIHKASVRDRIVHHCIYNSLYWFFDNKFIYDSYSCRLNKGTQRAMDRFDIFLKKESNCYRKTTFVLKCDIKKCFASVDHIVLKKIFRFYIKCPKIIKILDNIVDSFSSGIYGKGIPLGNLTSQLFINIYLNEFDLYIKHELKIKKYIRFADDFVVISENQDYLKNIVQFINNFLFEKLQMNLHTKKVFVRKISKGVDFLGWVHFPRYKVLRTKTKRRILNNFKGKISQKQFCSYMGLLKYGNTYKIQNYILDIYGNI